MSVLSVPYLDKEKFLFRGVGRKGYSSKVQRLKTDKKIGVYPRFNFNSRAIRKTQNSGDNRALCTVPSHTSKKNTRH